MGKKRSLEEDTLSFFSLIEVNINSIFVNGILSITKTQIHDLSKISTKFKDLELFMIAAELDKFIDQIREKTSISILMRLYSLTRTLERLYTKEVILGKLQEEV